MRISGLHVESELVLTESLIVKDDRAKVEGGCENKVSGDRGRARETIVGRAGD